VGVELIRKGPDAWNRWRTDHDVVRPNLEDADLKDANIRGAMLRRAHLDRATLINTDLGAANQRQTSAGRPAPGQTILTRILQLPYLQNSGLIKQFCSQIGWRIAPP